MGKSRGSVCEFVPPFAVGPDEIHIVLLKKLSRALVGAFQLDIARR